MQSIKGIVAHFLCCLGVIIAVYFIRDICVREYGMKRPLPKKKDSFRSIKTAFKNGIASFLSIFKSKKSANYKFRPERRAGVTATPDKLFGKFRMADKKRFSLIVSGAAMALIVPVIIISANGGALRNVPGEVSQQGQVAEYNENGQPNADSLTVDGLTAEVIDGYTGQEDQSAQNVQAAADGQPVQGELGQAGSEAGATSESSAASQQTGDDMLEAGAEGVEAAEAGAQGDAQAGEGRAEAQAGQQAQEPEEDYLRLEPESHHVDVKRLQARLMELNYMDNDEPTDYYGRNTQEAVKYFQRKHGLDIDAYAGAETQRLLFSEEAMPYSVTTEASGLDVENIQERLNELGYLNGATGYFGDKTENAVRYFQRMNGLDDDGSVGQYTKEVLFSSEAEPSIEYTEQMERAAEERVAEESSGGGGGNSDDDDGGSSGGGGGHTANPGSVESFIDVAQAQLGKPYVRGGKGSGSFDCSGLVYYALNQSGYSIGYMTSSGWRSAPYTTISSIGDLQRGDVICFTGHVGIYLGGGVMVDASSSKGQVVQRSLGSWAHSNFICGKRPL